MDARKHIEWAIALTLLVNAAAMLSPIINSGDAITYATLANHMVTSHDWVSLVLDGQDWLDKPHLPFWITALFFKLGGVSAQTYILPGFIFHLIGAYYTYRLARMFYGKQTAVLAVLIYVSVFNLMDASIEIKAETYLTGMIMPACYYWLRYDTQFRIKYLLLGAMFTAMAVMTKGIFTLFTVFSGLACLWIYEKQWAKLFSMKWLAAFAFSLLLVAPELIALQLQFGQHGSGDQAQSSLKFFFWDSQFGRFFNTGPIQNHNGNLLYFVLVFLWAFLPWTLVFFAAMYAQYNGFRTVDKGERTAFVFLASAFGCTFLMFSATKFQLDYYIDIIFPFAAILCAHYLTNGVFSRMLFRVQMGFLSLLALLTVALAIYVGNAVILAMVAAIVSGVLIYAYQTRMASLNFRTVMNSALAINLLYGFLVILTASAFTAYSLPYNAAKLTGREPSIPIYVFQMPEAARELALYSGGAAQSINEFDPAKQPGTAFYLLIRHDQAEPLHLPGARFKQVAQLNVVVHKTGTFNKLLQLAKGTWPLETVDLLEYLPS